LTAVVIFAPVLRPSIAEEPRFFAISAKTEVGDSADAGAGKPLAHIAGKIEMGLA
jgi:hypothetical protein